MASLADDLILIFDSDNEDTSDSSSSDSISETSVESSIDELSDGDVELFLKFYKEPPKKRICPRNYFEEIMPSFSDAEFRKHFRISRELFISLSDKLHNSQEFRRRRMDSRLNTAAKHLAVFLWFAGCGGCSFRELAQRFELPISSISYMIERVSNFLSGLTSEVITWPDKRMKRHAAVFFQDSGGFPSAIGAIGTARIYIDPLAISTKDEYKDSEGNSSLCLQAICGANKKFIDICVGLPGSMHNSQVLENSTISPNLGRLCEDYYILGDSKYACQKYLLTPYRDNGQLTSAQQSYNRHLNSCRAEIKHAFGMLKHRFPQLYYCKLKGIEKLNHFIKSCCVLHNLADESDLNFDEIFVEDDDENLSGRNSSAPQQIDTALGNAFRNSVCAKMALKTANVKSLV